MARTGRPPIFKDVDAFEKKLNWYEGGFFAWCKENEHIPLWEWFAVYMDCSRDAICVYMKKDGMQADGSYDNKQDFRPLIKRIGAQIMASLIEMGMTTTLKHDGLMVFYMKNYDYTDQQVIDTNLSVKITMGNNADDLSD
mgnify:CR=1 FL=1